LLGIGNGTVRFLDLKPQILELLNQRRVQYLPLDFVVVRPGPGADVPDHETEQPVHQ
jgi:hypothetical protein